MKKFLKVMSTLFRDWQSKGIPHGCNRCGRFWKINTYVELLLSLLRKLVEQNNTVVMIEHRPELIAASDWIIDIGPGGGSEG